MLSNILALPSVSRANHQQVIKQIWRLLSATPALHNLKHDTLSVHSQTITPDPSFVQNIAIEWECAKPYSEIPGTTRFQMIRGFMKGGDYSGMSFIDLLLSCRKKYGEIFLLPGAFGQKPLLSIFDINDFERVHRTEGAYPVRPGAEAIVYNRQNRRDGFFNETLGLAGEGKDWAHFRSAVNPVLMKPQNARLYLDPMLRVSEEFVQRIREIRDPVTYEVPGNFYDDINRLTFESLATVALDKQLGLIRKNSDSPEADDIFRSSHVFVKSIYDLGVKPSLYKYIRTPTYRRFEKAVNTMFDICKKYVDEALERIECQNDGDAAEGNSVLEKLLKIDRKVAMIMALDMLQAGVEPTSSVMAGVLLLLAKHPEKQNKLRNEILAAVSKDKQIQFTIENMKNLPYLRACIKEALRVYPITAGNFRETGMDIVLSGYRVPHRTRVIINSNLLLNEERFYPRAKEFIPERWLRGEESRLLTNTTQNPFVYLPFGFGPRTCVGKRIVDLELELAIACLVRNFTIEFNYPTENAFKCYFINTPAIPLQFKFTDL